MKIGIINLEINNIKDQATAANFADLATEHSDDPGGYGAGDLGWIVPGDCCSFSVEICF